MTATLEKPGAAERRGRAPSEHKVEWVDPRVDLMPSEVRLKRKQDKIIRRVGLVLVVVVAIAILAIGGSYLYSTNAAAQLASEQARTTSLLLQQQKYADVRVVQSRIARTAAAQQVGGSTEIDWKDFMSLVAAVTPPEVVISTIAVDAVSPMTTYTQATSPLTTPAVAGVTLTASSADIPPASSWITALKGVAGVSAVDVTSVTSTDGAGFTTTVILQVDESAFDGRYTPKDGE